MKEQTGKTQPNQYLTPSSVNGQRFTEYYSHGWEFIVKTEESWKTINFYPLTPREIWDNHQNPQKIIGLKFGKTTRFLTLDLDRHGSYHPVNDPKPLQTILESLEEIGLCRHVLIQSSYSEGIHIIFPLPEAVNTFRSACLVRTTLEAAGLEIKSGQLEIFPNTKQFGKNGKITHYNGLRLPLQPNSGSFLLDEDLNITSDRVEDFLDQMDWAAAGQDLEAFTSLLDLAYAEYLAQISWRKDTYSPTARAWKQALEQLLSQGWTGHHQTNYLLTKFVAYCIVFQQCQGEKLRYEVKQAVINAPGYSQWCRHQHEIDKRIEEVCYYTERNEYYLPYCNYPNRRRNYNGTYNQPGEKQGPSRTEDISNRLSETVAHLEETGQLPQQINQRREKIIKTAKEKYGVGFSAKTLIKKTYLGLWHPKYRDSEKTDLNQTRSKIQPLTDPKIDPKAPEPETEQSVEQSELDPICPIYEVFEGGAPGIVGNDLEEVQPATIQTTKNQTTTTTQLEYSAFTEQPSPVAPLKISDLPEEFQKRIAYLDANKQAFVSNGLPVPNVIYALEAELMTEIAQLISSDEFSTKSFEPSSNGKIDSVEAIAETTPQNNPHTESIPINHNQKTIKSQKTIDNNQSTDFEQPSSPTQTKPQKLSKKKLRNKCTDYGVEVNRTIEKLVKVSPVEVVNNALEALREHKRNGEIKNPAGFLVKAIKQKWQPSTDIAESSSSTHPTGITDEFLQWYKSAIASGLVEDVPVNWLPLYQHREPMVRVLIPDGRSPYTSMRWQEARDTYPLPKDRG